MKRKELGRWGEELAEEYLKEQDFIILERNYRCKIGEVDLVALDQDYLVFIEVKTRTSTTYGFPMEAVNSRKQRKYFGMASIYTKHKSSHGRSLRFDIIEVMARGNRKPDINHIKNAFQPSGGNYYT